VKPDWKGRLRRAGGPVARWAPLLVPPVYLALVLDLQPADRLGPPDAAPDSFQAIYDDADLTAVALRGLNAHLGRVAGRQDSPGVIPDDEFGRALGEDRPLLPRYYLEYPHTTLLLFRLGFWLQPALPPVPAAVLDGAYANVVDHVPAGAAERALWRTFRRAIVVYRVVMLGCLLALVLVLRAGYDPTGRLSSGGLLLVLPAALYFTVNRFDIVPTLLTALAFAAVGRRRPALAGAFLGLGALVKVYPALLAPLFLRYLWPDRRGLARFVLAGVATAVVFLGPPLLREGPEAVAAPYRLQLARSGDGEPDWTAYGYLFPRDLAENDVWGRAFRLGALVLAVGLLSLGRVPDLESLVRRSAVVLVVFMVLQVFYSPQWYLWLLPLLLPLTRLQRGLVPLVIALDVVAFLSFPLWVAGPGITCTRLALLGTLVLLLLRGGAYQAKAGIP
jgi:hypothetical protein